LLPEAETDGPLVSVVINNFNYADYVGRAIESALAQSYRRVEVVVVDDGSTDPSREVIAAYEDSCRIVFQANGGQGAAYNAGFAASRGAIILFLDSDDVLLPGAVAQVVEAWRPGVAKVQFYLDVVDRRERPLGSRMPNIPFVDGDMLVLLRRYSYYPAPPASGNAYARDALAAMLPMPEAPWRNGADGYLIGLAPLYGDVVSLHAVLGLYRVHGRNNSEVAGIDLQLLRRRLRNEIEREEAIAAHAARRGIALRRSLVLRIPSHCKARLLSLRFDRTTHPYAEDRLIGLVLRGIVASWLFPHASLRKRAFATAAFPLLALLPRRWLRPRLPIVFQKEQRRTAGDLLLALRRGAQSSTGI
jgi:glycosyltransferase involved in cell wall biosynthesis